MMTVMMKLVVNPRCIVARMLRLSACIASVSAASNSSFS